MNKMSISLDGIISKTTLLTLGGILLVSGVHDVESESILIAGTIKVFLGCLILLTREYCKTIPNGNSELGVDHTIKPKMKW